MNQKLPELYEEQWKFLAVLNTLAGPVSIDIVEMVHPLKDRSLEDLLSKCTEANLLRQTGKNVFSINPDLPATIRGKLEQISNPTWLSRLLDELGEFDFIDEVTTETIANLLTQHGRGKESARMNIWLAQVQFNKGDYNKFLNYTHRALKQLSPHLGHREDDVIFISAALAFSDMSIALGKFLSEVPKILKIAKDASDRLGDRRSKALINLHLGRIFFLGNQQSESIKCFGTGEAEVTRLGDNEIMDQAAEFLALYYFIQGKFKEAMGYFERTMQSFESQTGIKLSNSSASIWMGLNAAYLGQFYRAIGLLDFTWRHAIRESHYALATNIRAILGTVLLLSGNKREGVFHLQMAAKESSASENFLATFFSTAGLTYFHFIEGRLQEAWDMGSHLAAETVKHGMLGHFSSPWILEMVFEFERLGYDPAPGFEYKKLEDQVLSGPNIHLQGVALRLRARNAFAQGKSKRLIEKDLSTSEIYLECSGNPFQLAKTRIDLATLKLSQGNREEARALAEKAREGLSGYSEEIFPDWLKFLLDDKEPNLEIRDYQNEIMELSFQITEETTARPSIRYSMDIFVSAMNRFFRAERGCLFWSGKGKGQELELQATCNISRDEVLSESFRSNMELILKSFRENRPILIRDKRAIVSLPLDIGKLGRGVLYHDNSYLPDCFDFLNEPMLSRLANQLSISIKKIQQHTQVMKERRSSIFGESARMEERILFESPIMTKILDQTDRIARSEVTVLIQGETGVGKELLAQRLHTMSPRHAGPFITIDPATIPENLLESELFGHEKGAFTGADRQKPGRLELAHQGTLFIDEVGEVSKFIQGKLLRVFEEKQFVRIGGIRSIKSDFRLIAATNRNLAEEVEKSLFRKDLYYRINIVSLTLPPLRERREDIIILARYFLSYFSRKHSVPELKLTREDEARLISYDWPGNVRELKNVMERAAILNTLEGFELHQKPECKSSLTLPFAGTPSLDEVQQRYIRYVLEKTGGKIGGSGGAAELLGIKRTTLYNRMKKLGMSLTQ